MFEFNLNFENRRQINIQYYNCSGILNNIRLQQRISQSGQELICMIDIGKSQNPKVQQFYQRMRNAGSIVFESPVDVRNKMDDDSFCRI